MVNKRLAVLGTHSSGKTSLAKGLSSELNIPYIEGDIVQRIVEEKFHKKGPLDLTDAEYWEMEFLHYTHQLREATNNPNFVSDGGFILDSIYLGVSLESARKYPAYIAFHNLCIEQTKKIYSHRIYLPPDIPLEDDKFRPQSLEYRSRIDRFLVEVLNKNRIPYITARGSVEERVDQVLDYIKYD